MNKMNKKNISLVQTVLTVLYVSSLLISNVITGKQLLLPFNITMTGAVLVFPIVYILSDLFSEVYGYKWSRITCYLAFSMNLLMVVIFSAVISTPAPSYWHNQQAFELVLGNTPRILIASLSAFVLGDLINDIIFSKMKSKYKNSHKGFGLRAILSSLFGELIDSIVFLPIAFLGTMPIKTLFIMTLLQVIIKTAYEVIMLPLTNYIVKKVSKYEQAMEEI